MVAFPLGSIKILKPIGLCPDSTPGVADIAIIIKLSSSSRCVGLMLTLYIASMYLMGMSSLSCQSSVRSFSFATTASTCSLMSRVGYILPGSPAAERRFFVIIAISWVVSGVSGPVSANSIPLMKSYASWRVQPSTQWTSLWSISSLKFA